MFKNSQKCQKPANKSRFLIVKEELINNDNENEKYIITTFMCT